MQKKLLGLFLFFILTAFNIFSQSDNQIRTAVHLLDYIARDYVAAVENGKIIDDAEYEEQVEFSEQAYILIKEDNLLGDKKTDILNDINSLRTSIDNKEDAEIINKKATEIRGNIIDITGLAIAPRFWPDIENGRVLYQNNCALCHGKTGDGNGQAGVGLDPEPTNFLEVDFMKSLSPYQSYSTIQLGVPGTAMKPYMDVLTEDEMWDLAFFVKSLIYQDKSEKDLKPFFDKAYGHLTLSDVATLSDNEIQEIVKELGLETEQTVSAIRLLEPGRNSLQIAESKLQSALEFYKNEDKKSARTEALNAYLEGIEPVEARLRANSPSFVIKIEQQMLNVRQAIEKNRDFEFVEAEIEKAFALINEANQMLGSNKLNYWLTFLISLAIVLREGVEAFLVIGVVLVLIKQSNVKKALPWLHGGWIAALLAGVAGWFLSDYIMQFGGKNREIMEGLTTILAVLVLLYAGFWLHSNSQAKKWQIFIKEKVGKYLTNDRMIGLSAFSFMVVFREAFEVIIFLQSINIEAAAGNKSAIGLGVFVAAILIIVIAFFFQKYSKKIPLKELFLYSSWIIIALAVILAGKGIHSLQESGWISVSGFTFVPRFDLLGIYPTLETIGAQLIVILITFLSIKISKKRAKAL